MCYGSRFQNVFFEHFKFFQTNSIDTHFILKKKWFTRIDWNTAVFKKNITDRYESIISKHCDLKKVSVHALLLDVSIFF